MLLIFEPERVNKYIVTKNYFGGKSGSGTYQTLINHVPPHKTRIIGFLGLCGLTRNMQPAELNILNDLDPDLIGAWKIEVGNKDGFILLNEDTIALLQSDFLEKYDKEDTFIYLDPPYRLEARKGKDPVYKFQITDQQHGQLLAAVLTFKRARVMISHYPDEMYNQALNGWNIFDFWSTTHQGQALERIYYNYPLTGELHDYSYIGKDFREREKLSRIKNNFLTKFNRLTPQLRNAIMQDLASQKR
jgi:DNA adenine methylase